MRLRPFILGALTILLLGASAETGCTFPWAALIGNPLGSPITVRAVNDAYQPVQVSLTTSSVTNAATTAPSTQPTGGTVLEPDGQYETTFPCLTAPQALALKATVVTEDSEGLSATSRTLRLHSDYECGEEVTFTVRQAARVGLVVGDNVKQ